MKLIAKIPTKTIYFPKINCAWQSAIKGETKLTLQIKLIYTFALFLGILSLTPKLASGRNHMQVLVTLSEKNAPITKIFREIERQTHYIFLYEDEVLDKASVITIRVNNVPVEQALQMCFSNQPITFSIVDKNIIVKSKIANNSNASPSTASRISLFKGRVLNKEGEPIPGASIYVKGTQKSTISNENGEFSFNDLPENSILIITSIGYESEIVAIQSRDTITAILNRKVNSLDETIVIAYGTTTSRFLTGNISKVKSETIEKQPINNPILALQGRVPGLVVTQSNGLPGGGVTVRIQGQNSLNGGNDPLYVVDGVPYTSQMLTTTRGGNRSILGTSGSSQLSPGGVGNPLSFINPSDIESIEILKDADATSIYGSRAANGAILITTKKGKAGTTTVSINAQSGIGIVTKFIKTINTQDYIEMRREALANDGITTPAQTDYDINGLWDTTRYTNWPKLLIGQTAQFNNFDAAVSGGASNLSYLLGATYHKETTVYPGTFSDQKFSVHFNLNATSKNKKFKIEASGFYLTDKNRLPQLDLTANAYTLAPNAPEIFQSDGSLNWAPDLQGNSSWRNPLSTNENPYENRSKNLVGSISISYQITPGITLRTNLGHTNLQTNEFSPTYSTSQPPESRRSANRFAYYSSSTISSWIAEPQLSIQKKVFKGNIDILAGATFQQNKNEGTSIIGLNFNTDAAMKDILQAGTVRADRTAISEYKYVAAFARLNYVALNRYIVNLSVRRDGSSRFGPQSQFHNFGSIGAAWIFSDEQFLKNNSNFLSFGKIKVSYGTTGNDQIGDYTFMNLYNPTTGITVPYQGTTGLNVSGIPNPYLKWEETKKTQIGIDLGFLNDRITLNTSYSINNSTNQLLSYALPIISGTNSILTNLPAKVRNTSWEIQLFTANLKTTRLKWTTSVNFTVPRNQLVQFPSLSTSTFSSRLIIGKPISIVKTYEYAGIEEATGLYQFNDGKGGVTTRPDTADLSTRNVVISTLPNYYGGMVNTITFKNIELDFLFQFVKQMGSSGMRFGFSNVPGTFNTNQPASILNRWQKPTDVAEVQKFSSDGRLSTELDNALNSNENYEDASFIRLKNISLSYDLSTIVKKKLKVNTMKIYVQGQNVFTLTKFKGLDPESQNLGLPPLRVITFGLKSSF